MRARMANSLGLLIRNGVTGVRFNLGGAQRKWSEANVCWLTGVTSPLRSLTDPVGIRRRAHIRVLLLPTVKALGRHLPIDSSFDVEFLAASRTPDDGCSPQRAVMVPRICAKHLTVMYTVNWRNIAITLVDPIPV